MANIVVATYSVRYPLGGILSNALQYMLGIQRLGHDLYVVEKAGYPDSCFDPARNRMSDDCEYGVRVAHGVALALRARRPMVLRGRA
jgi:hypothetical protein